MSLLAGPRRKQRISIDPQNLGWKNDEGKFGKKMMEKMGWSSGKGLGRKEQGSNENVKLRANYSSKGLGCNHNYDDTWVEHHDDFAELLANLNKGKKGQDTEGTSKQTSSLEQKSKLSRARIHYQKFTRGKDLAQYSEQDKSAVLGTFKRGKDGKRKHEAEENGEEPAKKAVETAELNTIQSKLSVNEYFAEKMKKIKERNSLLKEKSELNES